MVHRGSFCGVRFYDPVEEFHQLGQVRIQAPLSYTHRFVKQCIDLRWKQHTSLVFFMTWVASTLAGIPRSPHMTMLAIEL